MIGFVVKLEAALYGYEFSSISESATTPLTTSMILPLMLGSMIFYFSVYSGYDKLDFWLTKLMAFGAFIVVTNPCKSNFITEERIGAFALSIETSNVLHYTGALILFGTFISWVGFVFIRSKRNKTLYKICAACSAFGILVIALQKWSYLPNPVFIGEQLILIPLGIAVIFKSIKKC